MPIRKELLDILVCPVTKQPLQMLSAEQVSKLNEQIHQGGVQRTDGNKVENPIEEGLMTTDAKTIYRVEDGIPIMLAEEGIAADGVSGL